jgi:hypothetical protein
MEARVFLHHLRSMHTVGASLHHCCLCIIGIAVVECASAPVAASCNDVTASVNSLLPVTAFAHTIMHAMMLFGWIYNHRGGVVVSWTSAHSRNTAVAPLRP